MWMIPFLMLIAWPLMAKPGAGSGAGSDPIAAVIDFDLRGPFGVANGKGIGFLHSLSALEPPDRFVDSLNIKLWRGACFLDGDLYRRLQRSGASIQYVLSDGFQHPTEGTCLEQQDTGRWPHQFPELWRQHVENTARQILANGWNVIWEPWNEPDYWPGSDKPNDQDLAFRQYLEAFRDSYRIIRKMDPHARFSGPSLSADASIGWTASKRRIEQFLAFCDQHQIEVADLTWHGFDDSKIFNYPERLRDIRQLAAQKYPAVRVQRILISEIVSENYFESPGDLIATLKYLVLVRCSHQIYRVFQHNSSIHS